MEDKNINIRQKIDLELNGNNTMHVEFVFTAIFRKYYSIEADRGIYASANTGIIASENGMSPVRRQAIIWIKVIQIFSL